MASSNKDKNPLTEAQREAVKARGNVLVMAGAGTGKTHTLVERCLHCLCEERPPASLEEIVVVTFTEAAAAEMRQRLRERLEEKLKAEPDEPRWVEQLTLFDTAHIGTLHSFCLKLIREHFHALGLDPQLAVLDEGEARLLAEETLEAELQGHYAGKSEPAKAVQQLIQVYGGGRDEAIRRLVLRLHHYAQTRPDADGWLARQIEKFSVPTPDEWQKWLLAAIQDWRDEWLPALAALGTPNSNSARFRADDLQGEPEFGAPPANEKAAEMEGVLRLLPADFSREAAAEILAQIIAADGQWPAKRKTVLRKPLAGFFDDARFLLSLAAVKNGADPLAEDWAPIRSHMDALLRLTQGFAARFAARKREEGVLDFHDLEQFALKLLWDSSTGRPSAIAGRWREKIRFVFVDEYQDINAAQDKIIQALSREGSAANRFLVGDVKQSIYRFRLADPEIFRTYAQTWRGKKGRTIPLTENFRSREGLLDFVNAVFQPLLREDIGGIGYDAEAQLQFGAPQSRTPLGTATDPAPRAELLLRLKSGRDDTASGDSDGDDELADLLDTEKEARWLAQRLKELHEAGHRIVWDEKQQVSRPAEWRDMAVLLRAPAGKAEVYAKEFQGAGVPLVVARGGFYDSSEILDLLSLLQLLDNPLQDVPVIAVLRSPLVGLSLDELAQIRLAARGHFWTALNRARVADCGLRKETTHKIGKFLERFPRWRRLARQGSLSQCLESVLGETFYADWLAARPRGAQRRAKIERLLALTQKFDQLPRQGLFRFLQFIEAQRETGAEPEVGAVPGEDAVRLMSIHQSKGLEFPIVALADLAKPFNTQELRSEIILDGTYGLCPIVQSRNRMSGYPSLPHWLARSHQRREQWGEELRLLYVALTRARDFLLLTGTVSKKKGEMLGTGSPPLTTPAILAANSYADWLGLWLGGQPAPNGIGGNLPYLRWRLAEDAELLVESPGAAVESGPPAWDPQTGPALQKRLAWDYPFAAATRRAAKTTVTTLRRQATEEPEDEAEALFRVSRFPLSAGRRAKRGSATQLSAADTGTAHHKFLQHFALDAASSVAALEAEANRLERARILSAAEGAALNLSDIAAFWNSDPGKRIRAQATQLRRELAFTARFSPAELETATGVKAAPGLEDEFVIVQGVADLVTLLPQEIWLVDFKTDDIPAGELAGRVQAYAPQLRLYAMALERIYGRPVTNRWLHFLASRRTEKI
ncbi:MAG TPA: UvrD-helicase domain-containing protein [Candidatus Acidoferrum sp.]|nr:UvrD-helicase domain-containing protein [Candidatus Acidoferrum sp.]